MSKKNVTMEVQEKIAQMQEKKANELIVIDSKIAQISEEIEKLMADRKKAIETMDLQGFKDTEQAIKEHRTEIEMYSGRRNQIAEQEYITEQESDAVIDSLLDYEKILEKEFVANIKAPITELRKILNDYFGAVQETEKTIRKWERQIHANYSTRGATYWTDQETGKRTDRSDKPVFVHNPQYEGCRKALMLNEYLNKGLFRDF